jgi:hypothetical protein
MPLTLHLSRRFRWLAIGLGVLGGLSACSARQGYASAQSWQRNQCIKIVDAQARIQCLRDADASYEDYQKAVEASRQKP